MLIIILAAIPLTLDRQACQVRNGTGDQGPKSHHRTITEALQGLGNCLQIRILDKV